MKTTSSNLKYQFNKSDLDETEPMRKSTLK